LLLYFILSQVSDGLKAMKGSPEVTSEIVDRVEKKRRDLYDVLKMRPGSMGDRVYWNLRVQVGNQHLLPFQIEIF